MVGRLLPRFARPRIQAGLRFQRVLKGLDEKRRFLRLNRPWVALRPNRFRLPPKTFLGSAVIHQMTIPEVLLQYIINPAILLAGGHQFERLQ